jgi:hypothetical protein
MTDDCLSLPRLEHRPFLTDSGLETKLIFIDGVELPEFATFVLLETADGRQRLRDYFQRHAQISRDAGSGRRLPSIGPRGDGYDPAFTTTPEAAERHHAEQIGSFADTEADLVSALTMTNRGGDRHNPSRPERRDPGGDLVHARDRWSTPIGHAARGGDSRGGRGHRKRARLLHDQLRPPDSLR